MTPRISPLQALADAIAAGDSAAAASALNALLAAWRAVSQGCAKGSKTCELLDHLLELLGMVANDVAPCEAAVEPALAQFRAATDALVGKNYSKAVKLFAAACATAGGGQRDQPPPELRIEPGSSWPSNRSIASVLLHRLGRQNGKIPCLFYHAKTVTENPFFANGCKFPEEKCKGWHLQGSES
mgnify:CR=1 FL=1